MFNTILSYFFDKHFSPNHMDRIGLIIHHHFDVGTIAMARINMIKSAVSRRTSAHAPMDNVTTPYNPIRLLKGAPPGQVHIDSIWFQQTLKGIFLIGKGNLLNREREGKLMVVLNCEQLAAAAARQLLHSRADHVRPWAARPSVLSLEPLSLCLEILS